MRVLQVITSLSTGGAEKLVSDLIPLFNKEDMHCDILSLKAGKTLFKEKLVKECEVIELTKGSVYNPFLIFKIIPHLKHYDLVHAHLFPVLYWVVVAKWLSLSKVKIIYTEHSTDNRRRKYLVFKALDRLFYKGIWKIAVITPEVRENLKTHLRRKGDSKFVLIPNGIDVKRYSVAEPYPKSDFFSDSDFILIQVSSFREQKDQPTLIRALTYLPTDVKLLFAGGGPTEDYCKRLVLDSGLTDRVKFLGVRSNIPRLFKTVDVGVLSSHYEGFGLVAIEGMASGKPFLASNVPGLAGIVENYGLLFKAGNEKVLADKVLRLKNDLDFYDKTRERCQKRGAEFDIQKTANAYRSLFEQALLHDA